MNISRRRFIEGSAATLFLSGCQEQRVEKTPLSREHFEFFSNGAILNSDPRLTIIAHPDRLNALVTEPNGGLKLPEDYIIVTIISPILPSQANPNTLLASIPNSLDAKIQSRFPKQFANRKYSVSFLLSQDVIENVMRQIVSRQPVPNKKSFEPDMKDIYKKLSEQFSQGWFFTIREQHSRETGVRILSGPIPSRIGELIAKAPPIEVLGMAEGAKFESQ